MRRSIKPNTVIKYALFALILTAALVTAAAASRTSAPTVTLKVYFTDAEMMHLIPVETEFPEQSTERLAQSVLDALIEGHDDNPKIYRTIPKIKRGLTVKLKGTAAYVDIKQETADAHQDGYDPERLTVYSIVNSLMEIDGIETVRFTIDGETRRKFKGRLDMRETFTADYFV